MAESQSNDNNTCVVCFKNVVYYSIGECDHPVCFECSTRMRVLCLQNECPICRQVLGRVVFTDTVKPYKELRAKVFQDRLFERQYKIGFCSEEIKQAYETLLENRCKLCENLAPFRTFGMLNEHVRKVHERYFCDLCVKHLRIFTNERRSYTRQELAHHRRKGDVDDTSHRGHPLCEFCEERFMDADELYRHLRKEHLYCHLCDADGRNLYYATHSALAHHFRTDHFLCEEGECANNHLTAVFRTEIDLKAHKATVHGRGMTRGAARQARTLELQFNITPHSVVQRVPRERERQEASSPPPSPPVVVAARIDTRSDEHFPRLSAAPPAPSLMMATSARAYKGVEGLARTDKNFPTLGGGPSPAPSAAAPRAHAPPAAAILRNSKPSVSIQLHSQPASASNFRLTQSSHNRVTTPTTPAALPPPRRPAHIDEDDFPSLGGPRDDHRDDHPSLGAGTVQTPKVALINSEEMQVLKSKQSRPQPKKQQLSAEAFPALGGGGGPGAPPPPQWITVAKERPRRAAASAPAQPHPAPPPQPRPAAFNPVADFPTLPTAKTKPTPAAKQPRPAATQPRPAAAQLRPAAPPPDSKPGKKDKKKQNIDARQENSEPPTPVYLNGFSDKFTKKQVKEAYNAAVNRSDERAPDDTRKIKTIEESATDGDDNKSSGGNGDFKLAANDYPPLSAGRGGGGGGGGGRPPCAGMTFTNSSGQTFPAPVHAYVPPPEFERRNRALVGKVAAALGGAGALDDFKVASRAFRDNVIDAADFYRHCSAAMGARLHDLLPELVALLPDIAKQQELAHVWTPPSIATPRRLHPCPVCGQLLAPADVTAHTPHH